MDSGRGKGRPGSKRGPPCRDDGLAPETPTQALETGKKRRITRDCPLLDLPEGVLEQSLLFDAGPRDLCSLAQTCSRLRTLVDGAEDFWQATFATRWGSPTAIQRRASVLAGGWKQLYAARAVAERQNAPWQRPSEHEVRAAIESLAQPSKPRDTCIVFLIDGSGSVTEDDFSCMTSFVVQVVSQIAQDEDDAEEQVLAASETENSSSSTDSSCQVSVLQFSNDCRLEIPPSPADVVSLSRLIDSMYRMNGGTNISLAIQRAGQLLKPFSPSTRRVLVLLTDGRIDSHQAREAREMARRLADEQSNVSLHAFGVGRGVDRGELLRIVGATQPETADGRYLGLCTLDEAPW